VDYEDRYVIATPEGVQLNLVLAGAGSRFIAGVIDLGVQALAIAALVGVVLVVGTAGCDTACSHKAQGSGGSAAVALAVVVVVLFVVQFGYWVAFEVWGGGRTPGKRLTGLRVVRTTGGPVGFTQSAVRNLVRLIDALPGVYLVGLVSIFVTGTNQRLGDLAAGTVVVRYRREAGRRKRARRGRRFRASSGGAARDTQASVGSGLAGELDGWDASGVTARDLATVQGFLDRRQQLTEAARFHLAAQLAGRLRPLVRCPDGLGDELFLESMATVKRARQERQDLPRQG
jgi:uncharacterized RDD family membrane protein YckC